MAALPRAREQTPRAFHDRQINHCPFKGDRALAFRKRHVKSRN
jgi:hypothetical protein